MQRSIGLLSALVLTLPATVFAATAVPIEPPRPGGGDELPSFTLRLDFRSLTPETDALSLAKRLQPGREGFDPELHAQLGEPVNAAPAIAQAPLPPWIRSLPFGDRWLMDRLLQLEYPAAADFSSLEQRLRETGLFVRIERDRAASYSADPADQYYQDALAPPAPARYQRQKWVWEHVDALEAWDLSAGGATIAVVDSGVEHRPTAGYTYHPELDLKVLRLQSAPGIGRSAAFAPGGIFDQRAFNTPNRGHGTHVAGLIGALSQNDPIVGSNPLRFRGVVGGCPLCVLSVIKLSDVPLRSSLNLARRQGVQVINRSGSRNDPTQGAINDTCIDPTIAQPDEDLTLEDLPFELEANDCPLLREITRREIPMVVSAGNHRRELGFPADQGFIIAVSGTDIDQAGQAIFWDDLTTADCTANGDLERGSNRACRTAAFPHRKAPDFAAPARRVLSTFARNETWSNRCSDEEREPNPGSAPPGDESVFNGSGANEEAYEWCTGTSMSAPIVSALIGLLRTANPLMRRESMVELLGQSAVIPVAVPTALDRERWGRGLPQGGEALKGLYGTVSGQQVRNRLTPMFHLSNPWTGAPSTPKPCSTAANEGPVMVSWRASGAHLKTTKPQVAVAALLNELYVDGRELSAQGGSEDGTFCAPSRELAYTRPTDLQASRAIGLPIYPFDATGLQVADEHELPRARFHVFTGPTPPREGLSLVTLVRFGYDDPWPLDNQATPSSSGSLAATGMLVDAASQLLPQGCPGLTRDFVYGILENGDVGYWPTIDPCPEDDTYLNPRGFDATYQLDGIEGYLLSACPTEFASCNGLNGSPMPIYLRSPGRYGSEGGAALQNWALIPGPDLPEQHGGGGPWAGYTQCSPRQPSGPPCGLLGYAFPNTDSDGDGLIDGEEWLIGTNRLVVDSDGDGYPDGFERGVGGVPDSGVLSATHYPLSDPLDPNSQPADLIFRNGVQQ